MAYRFRLRLLRVHSVDEQFHEPGKDELLFLGFGISRGGVLFSSGLRNLGSWSEGDDRSTGIFPMTLFEGDLRNDGLDVMASFWMIEEDAGGIAENAGSLEAEFRESFRQEAVSLNALGVTRECVPFLAFSRTLLRFGSSLDSAAYSWWNSDDVGFPREFYFRYEGLNAFGHSGQASSTFVVPTGGHYNCFLGFSYEQIQIVTDSP